jgi:hypothetical protein
MATGHQSRRSKNQFVIAGRNRGANQRLKKSPARVRRCLRGHIALPTASEKPPATATAFSAVMSGS